jgi:GTP-binding protein
MAKPLVAIVGRPNVGKSMLFNKLCGQRLSIVEDTPGVTRDRLYADCEWAGRSFTIVDTGGIEPRNDSEILQFMRSQAEIAIDNADVIVLVCDIRTGVTAADEDVARLLLRSGKPVVLAVNKADGVGAHALNADIYEFYNLGLGDPIGISAIHGIGLDDMLEECVKYFPPESEEEEDDDVIRVAVIGRPNVGKSSLVNRILGEERVIVSNMAGTTRDAVDSYFENEQGKFCFIDTAGMRKKAKVNDRVEQFSVLRATMAIDRADVCLILIDAHEGVTEQDTKVAGLAHEAGKASIIVVNKWDDIEKDDKTMKRMTDDIRRDLSYMTYAPVLFISALTGQRVHKLFELINRVHEMSLLRIRTGVLNSVLSEATTRVQPPTDRGRRLKIYYMTQAGVQPPTFVLFCNEAKLFHFSYQRYLENQIRSTFALEGTPIRMVIRERSEKEVQK